MSSVLFDNPGPRAIARNRLIGAVVVLLIAAFLAFVLWRFAESGQFSAGKWRAFQYPLVWQSIGAALGQTLAAFATAGVASIVLGLVLAVGRLSDRRWINIPVTLFIELFRAIPVLILMMLMYYGLPFAGLKLSPYLAVVIALTLYNGSVFSEIFRAGIEALPRGQKEAGYAVGLSKAGVMRLILFPQAIRSMLPVIIAQLVVALKDTALGSIITYNELLYYAKYLATSRASTARSSRRPSSSVRSTSASASPCRAWRSGSRSAPRTADAAARATPPPAPPPTRPCSRRRIELFGPSRRRREGPRSAGRVVRSRERGAFGRRESPARDSRVRLRGRGRSSARASTGGTLAALLVE
ncbi:amino acid ABC transporter permease [Rathayibacter sp. VKM Ac-2630]|uniref:amino acid ABC transporter permease n=1 Tax=Rathayibacter sp. VKM Ac-2630 TaxID=1938617 RepID=UPI0026BF1A25